MPEEKKEEKKNKEDVASGRKEESNEKSEAEGVAEGIIAGLAKTKAFAGEAAGAAGGAVKAVFKAEKGFGIIFLTALALHIYDIFLGGLSAIYIRAFLYIILSIVAFLTIFADWRYPFVISMIAIFFPILVMKVSFLANIQLLQFLLIVFPIWPAYILFFAPIKSSWFSVLKAIYLIVVVGLLMFHFGTPILNQFGLMGQLSVSPDQIQQTRDIGTRVFTEVIGLPTTISGVWQQQLAVATGDLYTGEVEKNKQEQLGVYIQNLQQANPVFYEGDPVIIWATINARSIDEDITVTPSCTSDDLIPGFVSPTKFTAVALEQQDVQCSFNSLKKGFHKIDIGAEFNFKTMSYIKGYFMDVNKLRSLRRENIDPLDQYKIADKNPVAVFTNGPVGIGMNLPSPMPIGVSKDQAQTPTLGISLINRWEGKIVGIKKLVIYVPNGFSISLAKENSQTGDCDHKFEKDNSEEDQQEGYNAYELSSKDPAMKMISELQEVSGFQTFKCRLTLDDPEKVIGSTPINTLYFKVTASYFYKTKKSISVEVKGAASTTQ